MKIKFTDWEIEKNNVDDFYGYARRYCLEEIVNEKGSKVQARILIATNDFDKIIIKLGEYVLNGIKIEFVENDSLVQSRKSFIKNNLNSLFK